MKEVRARGDERAYLRLDSAFHGHFFANCNNRYVAEVYARLAPKIAALRTHLAIRPDHTRLSYEEHQKILQAVRRSHDNETMAILERHIDRTRSAYTRNIEDIAAADRAAGASSHLGKVSFPMTPEPMAAASIAAPRLELLGLCKAYSGVPVVVDVCRSTSSSARSTASLARAALARPRS